MSTPTSRLPGLLPTELGDKARGINDMAAAAAAAGQFPFKVADEQQRLVGMFRVFVHAPDVGEVVMRLGLTFAASANLTERMRDLAMLITAASYRSDYEWYAHEQAARDKVSSEELEAIRRLRPLQLADRREQVVVDVTRALLDDGDLDDDLYHRGVAALGQEGLVELIWVVAMYGAAALQLRVHRLGVPDGEPAPEWE